MSGVRMAKEGRRRCREWCEREGNSQWGDNGAWWVITRGAWTGDRRETQTQWVVKEGWCK